LAGWVLCSLISIIISQGKVRLSSHLESVRFLEPEVVNEKMSDIRFTGLVLPSPKNIAKKNIILALNQNQRENVH